MNYLGDFAAGASVRIPFDTVANNGASTDRGTKGTVRVYKDSSVTERASANGISDTGPFDTVTGLSLLVIDLSDNSDAGFYAAGHDYYVVLLGAKVGGQTINPTIASFSIQNRYSSALDAAGVRAAVGLASANLDTQIATIQADTDNIQTRLPAALVSGRMDSSVGAVANDAITAASIAADAITAAKIADGAIDAATFAAGAIDAAAIAADAIGSSELAASAVNKIADQVWEETLSDHSGTSGSTAEALGAAGAAGDPWSTALPGAYGAGTAGQIIGDNLDATVSSRLASASISLAAGAVTVGTNNDKADYSLASAYDAAKTAAQAGDAMALTSGERSTLVSAVWDIATAALTTVGSIGKRIADNLDAAITSRLASASYSAPLDAAGTRTAIGLASANLDTQLSGIAAKTTNLPATPAATGDAMALTSSERNSVADALLDRGNAIETGLTVRGALRVALAALAGKVSGADMNAPVFRNVGDSKDRITATTTADGNRISVTTDAT